LFFFGVTIIGGFIYYNIVRQLGETAIIPSEGIYHVLGLMFLQPTDGFSTKGFD